MQKVFLALALLAAPLPGLMAQEASNDEAPVVTGEWVYPLNFQLNNLGLSLFIESEERFQTTMEWYTLPEFSKRSAWLTKIINEVPRDYENEKILSLGEGSSALVPWLNEALEIEAYGVDLWYGTSFSGEPYTSHLTRYYDKYKTYLIKDDAVTLKNVKAFVEKNGKFKTILGHFLFQYIPPNQREEMLRNCLSVLKNGGTLRFNNVNDLVYNFSEEADEPDYEGPRMLREQMMANLKTEFDFDYAIFEGSSDVSLVPPTRLPKDSVALLREFKNIFFLDVGELLPDDYKDVVTKKYDELEDKSLFFKNFYQDMLKDVHKEQYILVIKLNRPRKSAASRTAAHGDP